MSRTLNGNPTGAAAHRSWDDVPSEPLDPEIQKAIETDFYELEIFLRDKAEPGSLDWQAHNRVIEKLRRGESLFSDRADEIEPTEADAQALERRLAQLDECKHCGNTGLIKFGYLAGHFCSCEIGKQMEAEADYADLKATQEDARQVGLQ